jgi:hypothetical protein
VTYSQLIKAGDKAARIGNHYAALNYYKDALAKEDSDQDLWYKYGNSALDQYAYNEAAEVFTYLLDTLKTDRFDDLSYKIANINAVKGDYETAKRYYTLYLAEYEDEDDKLTRLARKGVESAEWAMAQDSTDLYKVIHLDGKVNSPYSEHSPVYQNDNLEFVSMKFKNGEGEDQERYFSKILKSSEGVSEEMENIATYNDDGLLTSDPSYTEDGSLMFYTICQYDRGDKINCDIYYRKQIGDSYREGVKIESINSEDYTSTHPAVAEVDGKRILVFASDQPGGAGGMDLWYSEFNTNLDFSKAFNLKSVNTEADEISPHIYNKDNELYFSSNGRVGFGGFDIFKSKGSGSMFFEEPENMGRSVNSSYNDIHFSISQDDKHRYFASNRKGSMFLETKFETCCYDIYELKKKECQIELETLVFDAVTKEPLENADIVIIDKETEEAVYENTLENTNKDVITLDCEKNYTVQISREGYKDGFLDLNYAEDNFDLDGTQDQQEIYLEPAKLSLRILTYEDGTALDLYGVTIEITEIESGETQTKTRNEGNTFNFAIDSERNYKLTATKEGYQIYEESFKTDREPLIKKIYLKKTPIEQKIATLQGVLPIQLFFDNDQPYPKSMRTTSDVRYTETYVNYYNKKDRFATNYGGLFGGDDRIAAKQESDNFFEGSVKVGNEKIDLFLTTLDEVLLAGREVNLYFRGYASPVSVDEYNFNLGKRRVETLINEIYRHRNGALRPYIEKGQLILTERSFGESTAPSDVSDDINNPRKSIFSPQASKERRVEIEEIDVSRDNLNN